MPEYAVWRAMRQRCNNPYHRHFKSYGGRGIKVCDSWNKFDNFLQDMGLRPSSPKSAKRSVYSIDRIDNNKGYYPSNCRWATTKEQSMNRGPHRISITKKGYRGVKINKNGTIYASFRKTYLGVFKTAKAAAKAWNKEAVKTFGKFAILNKI